MALYKRGTVWWVHFVSPDGTRIRESTRATDRKLAQEYHDKRKYGLWMVQKLGERKSHLWEEAVMRWLEETKHKASHRKDVSHLRWLDPYLRGTTLEKLTRDVIDELISTRSKEGVSNATVNRTFEILRAILRKAAYEWDWIQKAPVVRRLKEPKRRVRWLTPEEARRLLVELPPHLQAMAGFSLATGLRQSNVVELRWDQVDIKRKCAWIHADQSKSGNALGVPLNPEALRILTVQHHVHPIYVFTYRGSPVKQVNGAAWKKALARAGIKNFRWHDLRHTWASWLSQRGVPQNVLQELGGWSSPTMVRRYAHLAV